MSAFPRREIALETGAPRLFHPPTRLVLPVASSRPLTPTAHGIELEKPSSFNFLPTQFTFLQLVTDDGVEARPMSLATSPTRPHLGYAVRLSQSPYKRAFSGLRPGDEVAVFGPLGDFVLDQTRPAVLLAGGIGVTPLKGMAEYAADVGLPIAVRLVYSNRSEEDIPYRDDIEALERENPQFRVFHTLTGVAGSGWPGATGRIDRTLLEKAAGDLARPIYYVSGTPSMVAGTWRLLRGAGVPEDDIEVEAFRGYV